MGPLPAFFYPVFQLVDYAVHSWDIREGTGRPHALEGRAADLLVPLCFVLWRATAKVGPDTEPMELGVRITSGRERRRHAHRRRARGADHERRTASTTCRPCIEFDPASFVLTAYGRMNAGTVHGDRELGHEFLDGFFRI